MAVSLQCYEDRHKGCKFGYCKCICHKRLKKQRVKKVIVV